MKDDTARSLGERTKLLQEFSIAHRIIDSEWTSRHHACQSFNPQRLLSLWNTEAQVEQYISKAGSILFPWEIVDLKLRRSLYYRLWVVDRFDTSLPSP